MVFTRKKHTAIFVHVIGLIGEPADGSGRIATMLKENNISNIYDICDLSRDHIATPSYTSFKQEDKSYKGTSKSTQDDWQLSSLQTESFKALSWLTVDQEMFDDFRIDYDPDEYLRSAALAVPSAPIRGTTPTVDPLRDFKRGIKRDPTLFPVLKDTKQWDAWYVETKAQARAQDVDTIFDRTYVPTTDDAKAIHEQK